MGVKSKKIKDSRKKGIRITAWQMIGDGGILGSYFVYQAQTLSCWTGNRH